MILMFGTFGNLFPSIQLTSLLLCRLFTSCPCPFYLPGCCFANGCTDWNRMHCDPAIVHQILRWKRPIAVFFVVIDGSWQDLLLSMILTIQCLITDWFCELRAKPMIWALLSQFSEPEICWTRFLCHLFISPLFSKGVTWVVMFTAFALWTTLNFY